MNRGGVPLNFYEGGGGSKKLDMIDVDVSFVNISANNEDNNNSPLG